jgi:hypothetical protein
MVNELELKKIWVKLGEKFSDQRKQFTYEYFKNNMQSEDGRKKFWNMFHDKIDLGKDFNTYEKNLTTDTLTSTTQQTASVPPPPEPVKTIDYKIKYPSEIDPTKPFNYRNCDDNVYDWDYGCKNDKIGEMNQILFGQGKTLNGIYGSTLLTKLKNLGYLKSNETKITEKIYNQVIKLGEEQGYVKLQESIVKQTVKNILKERLIKN